MLSDRDALFAAIRANPEEDTPRLMFADWLDEHGEPERAEFIRLQIEQARMADDGTASHTMYAFLRDRYPTGLSATDWTRIDPGVHRLIALAVRAADLLRRHRDGWLPKLPKKCKAEWGEFHRGFPHRVTLDVRKPYAGADRLRGAVPAVTLVAHNPTGRFVEQLAHAGLLQWVTGLDLGGDCATAVREFGRHKETAGVRALKMRLYGGASDTATALAEGTGWTGLREIDWTDTAVESEAADRLFGAEIVRSLRRLHLHGSADWTADTIRVLAGRATQLDSLRLDRCGLDDDTVEILAESPGLGTLRTLDLSNNYTTGRGFTALLCSPHLARVENLVLDGNPCTGPDAKRLAATGPGGLRMLHFHGSRLRTADVRALARCPRLRSLWYLDIDDNQLGTSGVRELVRGFGEWCPPILWLAYNRIGDRGAEHLANWPAATGLSALHLKYNPGMTDAGVRTLLDSPHLANLDCLGVSTQSAELDARLRARFRHPDVNY